MDPWIVIEALQRGYDAAVNRGAPFHHDEFIAAYTDAVAESQAVIREVDRYTSEELRHAARGLLRLIVQVFKAYHRKVAVEINANFMAPVQASAEALANARFCTKDRRADTFFCFLELIDWAYPSGAYPKLVLPVELSDERVSADTLLFGAPDAFVNRRSYLVNDTGEIWKHSNRHENLQVRREIGDYFGKHQENLRSFISIPVFSPPDRASETSQPLGVINVQSNRTRLMGLFPGNQRKLELTLAPLVRAFAYCAEKEPM